jgi:hypothetical protein
MPLSWVYNPVVGPCGKRRAVLLVFPDTQLPPEGNEDLYYSDPRPVGRQMASDPATGRPRRCSSYKATPRDLTAARPDFTRSRMRSRSNSAKPAMIVRMSLPLAVLRSKLSPV